jgi:hypothetical protein
MTCLDREFIAIDKEENKVYTNNGIIECMFRACGWDVVDATPYDDYCLDTEAWD